MIRRPPRSTLFPTRRSSDLLLQRQHTAVVEVRCGELDVAESGRLECTVRHDPVSRSDKLDTSNWAIRHLLQPGVGEWQIQRSDRGPDAEVIAGPLLAIGLKTCAWPHPGVVEPVVIDGEVSVAHEHVFEKLCRNNETIYDIAHAGVGRLRTTVAADAAAFVAEDIHAQLLLGGQGVQVPL